MLSTAHLVVIMYAAEDEEKVDAEQVSDLHGLLREGVEAEANKSGTFL